MKSWRKRIQYWALPARNIVLVDPVDREACRISVLDELIHSGKCVLSLPGHNPDMYALVVSTILISLLHWHERQSTALCMLGESVVLDNR